MFKNDTPSDILDIPVDEIYKFVEDPPGYSGPSPRVRLNFVKMLYDVLGYHLTPDAALCTIGMNTSILTLATAGSGKTTLMQIKTLLFKLVLNSRCRKGSKMLGKEILCLVYNRHNVPDIRNKHMQMTARLKAANIKGLSIDDDIRVYTMHSFCDMWRKQYVAKLGLTGFTLLTEEQSLAMMKRSINLAYKMLKLPIDGDLSGKNLLSFYVLCKESCKCPSEMQDTDKFRSLGAGINVIEKCFERFEVAKKTKKTYDYCDMLVRFYELVSTDEKVLKDIQRYYSVVICDEVQDFTPIMWKILKVLVGNGKMLDCIGDEDQSIYYFRGADIHSLLEFKDNFEDGKVYTLAYNRRCRKAVLDEAKRVITQNILRFDKQIVGSKPGGSVSFIPYNTAEGQISNLVAKLSQLPEDDLYDTVVCYRERDCSLLLTEMLEEKRIPFNSLQGSEPFQHELYRHVFSVIEALEMPYDREASLNLYKVLPCTRTQLCGVLGYDPVKRKFIRDNEHKHFIQYDYGRLLNVSGFTDILKKLLDISGMIKTQPLTSYVEDIFNLLHAYFWNFIKSTHENTDIDNLFEDRVYNFFNRDCTYSALFDDYCYKRQVCGNNNASRAGVTLSTFHGLKGLEFKHVYAIYMDNDIFPNFPLIESRGYADNVTKELEESETRLWYVAVTRAIDDLTVYYSAVNPSYYVQPHIATTTGTFIKQCDATEVVEEKELAIVIDLNESRFAGDFEDDFDNDFEEELNDGLLDFARETAEAGTPVQAAEVLDLFNNPIETSSQMYKLSVQEKLPCAVQAGKHILNVQ